jgi:CBS domain-containing protein
MVLDVKVGNIARREFVTIDEEASVESAAALMRDRNLGSLIVTRKGLPVGIVTERDMLRKILADARDPRSVRVDAIMTSSLVTIEHDQPLSQAIDLMNRRRLRRMLVTENGKLVGIFTQRDVLGLNRLCLHCGKEIISGPVAGSAAQAYIQCACGARYHSDCAKTIVHCVDCARTLVMDVIYPDPSETMGG